MPRFDAAWIEAMVGAERAAATPPGELLNLAQVRPGDRVADVGCGTGFLTLPAARRVGDGGLVWALNAAPEMVDFVAQRAATAGLGHAVQALLVDSLRLPLDDGVADVTLGSLVLHFFKEPHHDHEALPRFARELRRVSAPAGRLLVVEWRPRAEAPRPNRLTEEECAAVLQAAGWQPAPAISLGTVARRVGRESMYAIVARPAG